MNLEEISRYRDHLEGCRFCPMCKPAAEVANVTQFESHSTRARAMMLWRLLEGMLELSERDVEILYQSTLDTISEAWCVHHYKVSSYLLAVRKEMIRMLREPEWITRALKTYKDGTAPPDRIKGDTVFLAGELAEFQVFLNLINGSPERYPGITPENAADRVKAVFETADRLLNTSGGDGTIVTVQNGAFPYTMGDVEQAEQSIRNIANLLSAGGIKRVIPDGPQTLWVLKVLMPLLTEFDPGRIEILSLSEFVQSVPREEAEQRDSQSRKVLFHDSRYPFFLGKTVADDRILSPDYTGPEDAAGRGDVYEIPRNLLNNLGYDLVYSWWARSLCRSCGSDDGLYMTYPEYARGLAVQCFEHAEATGAELIVTESPLSALYLSLIKHSDAGAEVSWLPELVV